jgi:hypothetical protein
MADIKPESGALPPISVNIFARPINMIVASKRSADVLLQSLLSFRGPGGMIFQRHDAEFEFFDVYARQTWQSLRYQHP